MVYSQIPKHQKEIFKEKTSKYCVVIPVINEGDRIQIQLKKMRSIAEDIDMIIADGGSSDGSLNLDFLKECGIRALLIKQDSGKLSAQLRMAYKFALDEGYEGIITVDGNGKDSVESIYEFVKKLNEGFDMVQGSRYIPGGAAINTPKIRHFAVKLIHIPIISILAGFHYTDTTNGFRAYSKRYLEHPKVEPFRDIFDTYELLAYLSVKAPRLGLKTCEVPVSRTYPNSGKVPTKISSFRGNLLLLKILFDLARKKYDVV